MSSVAATVAPDRPAWRPPLVPGTYGRGPLTAAERAALAICCASPPPGPRGAKYRGAVQALERLERPLADIVRQGGQDPNTDPARAFRRAMRHDMHRRGLAFWDWSPAHWLETLGATGDAYEARHGQGGRGRFYVQLAAYFFGEVADLRRVNDQLYPVAAAVFGRALVDAEIGRLRPPLAALGYATGDNVFAHVRAAVSALFLANRSPYLADLTPPLLADLATRAPHLRWLAPRIATLLRRLDLLPEVARPAPPARRALPTGWEGIGADWRAWVTAWYARETELSDRARGNVVYRLQAVGRWLRAHAPAVATPEQWTEELALRFRHDVAGWTVGRYAGSRRRSALATAGRLDHPLSAESVKHHLGALKRFLLDLQRRPHAVAGAPARRIALAFHPREALTLPRPLRRRLAVREPRDIDQRHWAKLTIAAATLAASDLPPGTRYPLGLYRALGLLWVTAARRPNELLRLRLDCLRRDWDPAMRDDEGRPLPARQLEAEAGAAGATDGGDQLCYLHIPAGKHRGPFWIWVPDYTAAAIDAWKAERPAGQRPQLDDKDREAVDYLFAMRERRVGQAFFNAVLIPLLCRKAGVEPVDAKGRITGHRGRSTRLTLLRRNGVSLEDLAAYAGHLDTATIRRYANQDPLQLHRTIKAADDLSRVIEGVVDLEAAARGLPALRWFLGYDADGAPAYCANQAYHTCPHRLDCVKCGMFVGGDKARLLHEGEDTLPVSSTVPMTPVERCLLRDDAAGLAAERAALAGVPPPEPPSPAVIFNPQALGDRSLAELAAHGTPQALVLLQAAEAAYARQLAEAPSGKTGRNAVVRAQRRRLASIQERVAACQAALDAQQHRRDEGADDL